MTWMQQTLWRNDPLHPFGPDPIVLSEPEPGPTHVLLDFPLWLYTSDTVEPPVGL